jgi:LacI family transcriptional regulator
VAEHTGLSVATISKYLNGTAVREKNRSIIESAIKELDYQVNPFARSLKTRRSNTVGALLPSLNAPFFANVLTGIDETLRLKDLNLIICFYDMNVKLERGKLESLLLGGIDGLIYAPEHVDKETFERVTAKRRIPVVMIDRMIPNLSVDTVLLGNSQAIYEAAELLIAKHHTRIGFIAGQPDVFTAAERQMGLERALADYGLPIDRELFKHGHYTVSDGYRLFNELIDMPSPPTAIMTSSYDLTRGAITAANERNINLPQELDFFGFDSSEICRLMKPPLPTIEQPERRIGELAAQYIIERLEGESAPPRLTRLKAILHAV